MKTLWESLIKGNIIVLLPGMIQLLLSNQKRLHIIMCYSTMSHTFINVKYLTRITIFWSISTFQFKSILISIKISGLLDGLWNTCSTCYRNWNIFRNLDLHCFCWTNPRNRELVYAWKLSTRSTGFRIWGIFECCIFIPLSDDGEM